MKFKGSKAALAALLGGALMLGACTSGEDPATQPPAGTGETSASTTGTGSTPSGDADTCKKPVEVTAPKEGQVIYGPGPGKWSGYNNLTSATYSTYNSVVSDRILSSFVYFGTDGTICEDKDFGTIEVLNEDPLEVKYTISDKAVWSDGTPVTINDYLLDWAAQNPEFLVPGRASGENKDTKAVFDHVSSSLAEQVLEGPQGEIGSKTFTLKYQGTYPDWKLIIGNVMPAHVVAKQSGLEPDALAQAILDRDAETVKKAAEFWNTGWNFEQGQLPDASVIPSMGPYQIKQGGWEGTALTLEANPKYWGTPPATQNLIFRYIEDAQMAQSLQNGDLNVIDPQATVDTVGQLQNIGPSVKVETFSTLTWEHLDFNFRDTNVFSDAQGGLKLRQAFAHCVPRQAIVDSLIKPIDPGAEIMNAREAFPFQEKYDEVVKASYDGRYDQVDIEKAKQLVAESGVATPIKVRVGYRAGNQRRAETVAAIQASCKDAGFEVEDTATSDFFDKQLPDGDYEVALYAWASSGQLVSGQNIYSTDKPQNYGKYSNAKVDESWKKMTSTLDDKVLLEETKVLEKELWDTLFGLPLYAHPGVMAYDARIGNVRSTATQNHVVWNGEQWQLN
ncbi:ABC transporter family substrate-binding protein [Arachnia propionica]|uniref:ABC transporter family substrate-binding protein n=1 Tax=Arachnia propionica TaxID=1750 RepID=A0A3P1TB98_9ACTN|nr:ABC transporter family substrate-binding protein [Arachnia propionica]RRD06684.1 ABC transporter family substrate-binding protein [Arachnia propionica]